MAAVLGIRIKTSDLVAHIANDEDLSGEISNVGGTDGVDHIEAAVSLMRDADRLMLVARGVADLLAGVFEISPDGSMTFYDPDSLAAANETLKRAYGEIHAEKRPVCASLGITDQLAIADIGDIQGLLNGLIDYHEEVVEDEIGGNAFERTMLLRVQEGAERDDGDDEIETSPPQPAPTGEIEGFATIVAIRTGSAGVAVDVVVAREDGSAYLVAFSGDDAPLVIQAITTMEGRYAVFRARVGSVGQGEAFWIAPGDSSSTTFMDH